METSSVVRLRAQSAWAQPVRGRARDRAGALARPRRVRCGRAVAMLQQHPPHPPPPPSVRTVTIPFSDLKERGKDLSGMIEEGLGPNGLGIISISDVPDFPVLRRTLLRLAPRVASLPEDVKKELEDPDSRYNFGWSHGKEKLESGKLDTFKGSYYANPILDVPTTNDVLVSRYPSYCRPNIWPADHLPELEIAFKALGKLMLEVGLMLAHHCDLYVMQQGVGPYDGESLEQTIARSRCHKGRLLYYFPRQFSKQKEEGRSVSSWCGWHTDHGSLTGLTCGLFTRNSVEIPCTDSAAGLYIQTRDNRVVKRLTNGYAFEKEGIICEVYTPGGDHGNRWRPAAGGISFSLFQFAIVAVINAKMNKKPPAFVNGFLHWLIDPALIIRRPRAAVISFSLEEETFRCVRSPPFWRSVVHTRSRTAGDHLVEMDNQLCMVRDLRNNPYGSSLEIWRLLDYSSGDWTLNHRIDLLGHVARELRDPQLVRVIGSIGNCRSGKKIIIATSEHWVHEKYQKKVHTYDPRYEALETILSTTETHTSHLYETPGSRFSLFEESLARVRKTDEELA